MAQEPPPKPLEWIGSSRKDIRALPEDVRDVFGFALFTAQMGAKHPDAKPLKGFGGGGVLEVVADESGSTYRAVYTVKLKSAVYVLHVFQKKSKKGIRTPKKDIDIVKARLNEAVKHHRQYYEQRQEQSEGGPPPQT